MPDRHTVEIPVEIKAETDLAWLVEHADGECWLPKSETEIMPARYPGGPTLASIPEWLAEREDLL